MIHLIDTFVMNMGNVLISTLALDDYRKAFDVVDHGILLQKLSNYKLSLSSTKWFISYQQKVSIGNKLSSVLPVTSHVPQRSILGPLPFIIFVNYLPLLTQRSFIVFYADDTTFVSTVKDVEGVLCEKLTVLDECVRDKNMALNCDKTNSMLDCGPPKLQELKSNSVHSVKHVSSTKLLGLHSDSTLSWNNHIQYITKEN